jgi:hypothetical protein
MNFYLRGEVDVLVWGKTGFFYMTIDELQNKISELKYWRLSFCFNNLNMLR